MRELFKPENLDNQSRMLANHMPVGKIWSSVFDPNSNLGKLIRSLGIEYYRLQLQTKEISDEIDVNKTLQLLDEWEKSVGIPGNCFDTFGTLEERRLNVKQKLADFGGVQTEEDFIRVCALFGFDVQIVTGSEAGSFPLEFPVLLFDSTRSSTHTIFVLILNVITGDEYFPISFPIPFSSGGTTFLECILNVLAPANVQVIVTDSIT